MTFGTVVLMLGGIWIFFTYPKQVIKFIAVISVISFVIWIIYTHNEEQKQKERDIARANEQVLLESVRVYVFYDEKNCPKSYPLNFITHNKTNKTLNKVSVDLEAYIYGYSKNIVSSYPYKNKQFVSYTIIAPNKTGSSCFRLPEFDRSFMEFLPNNLIYKTQNKGVTFSDGSNIGDCIYD